ncbi:hypothetical protein DYY66_1843 [Candidatus Nitrosotalea sp. FS]|nr:hypothetical protein [Candidatus Nitrosotalea sp. FS]
MTWGAFLYYIDCICDIVKIFHIPGWYARHLNFERLIRVDIANYILR